MPSATRSAQLMRRALVLVQLARILGGCARDGLDRQALLDPGTCQGCHPDQYREWSGSMHAYASDDPVFRAMTQRGNRETGGAVGPLCAGCHAPLAVREGVTTDASNLDDVPRELRGVTCMFCHSVDDVAGDHNDPLVLADDGAMRGELAAPISTGAHRSMQSRWLDGRDASSARACGACHDVVTPAGLALERTYAEWQTTIFAQPQAQLTCAQCHMKGRDGRAAAVRGAPVRRVTSHLWAGLDAATTPWPQIDTQEAAIVADLEPSVSAKLCVNPGGAIDVTLDNVLAGHAWPSGVTHSRRAWVELTATAAGSTVLHDESWVLGETLHDAQGHVVQMPWAATSSEAVLLQPATTVDSQAPGFYHAVTRHFAVPPQADHVAMHVWIQPIAAAVLDDLVASGDLARELATPTTIEVMSARRDWTTDAGYGCR